MKKDKLIKNAYTHISVILDRSGSMNEIRDDTIGGSNTSLGEQKAQKGKATLTLAQFEISLAQAQRDIEYMRIFLSAPLKYKAGYKGYELENKAFCLPSVWIEDDSKIRDIAKKTAEKYKLI